MSLKSWILLDGTCFKSYTFRPDYFWNTEFLSYRCTIKWQLSLGFHLKVYFRINIVLLITKICWLFFQISNHWEKIAERSTGFRTWKLEVFYSNGYPAKCGIQHGPDICSIRLNSFHSKPNFLLFRLKDLYALHIYIWCTVCYVSNWTAQHVQINRTERV